MKSIRFFIGAIIFCLIAHTLIITAQPSGGPYGPVRKNYNLPAVDGKVYFVSPDGKSEATGRTLDAPTTIEAAIERVKTGDAIVMRGGTYRTGNLLLNQGITIQPYADEQPIMKGTYIATDWRNLRNGLWVTSWQNLFPSEPLDWWNRDYFGRFTPLHRFNNDMVFIDGKFLNAVGRRDEVDSNSYFIDYTAKKVYIGTNPENRLVEITAFDAAIIRKTGECHGKVSDKKGYIIRGVTFTQYAFRALEVEGTEPEGIADESKYGKDVVGTTLEDCTISYCSRVAAYLRGDRLTIRNCRVSDTSTEGIYIIASNDVLLEKNIFMRNNIENISGYYPAAVKIFNQSRRVTCRDNLVTDLPNSNGIWYDVGNVDGVFINNWIQNVGSIEKQLPWYRQYPSNSGFFFEISKRVICAGNVFVNCDNGIFILNSSDAQVYNNTFINSTACFGRNARSPETDPLFGWHSGTGPAVNARDGHVFVNNLLMGDDNYEKPLLFEWQPDTLCKQLSKPQFKQLDYNVYIQSANKKNIPLILWSSTQDNNCRQIVLDSPASLNKLYPEFSSHSKYFIGEEVMVFKSKELGNYELLPECPVYKYGIPIPSAIGKLVGVSKKDVKYVGAYPPVK